MAAQPGAVSDQQIQLCLLTHNPQTPKTLGAIYTRAAHSSQLSCQELLFSSAHPKKSKCFYSVAAASTALRQQKSTISTLKMCPVICSSLCRRHSAAPWDTNWRWDCTFCWNQRMASSFPILCLAPMLPVLRFLSAMLKPGLPSTCRTKPTALLHPAAFCFPDLSSFPGGKPGVSSSVMPCCHFCVIPAAAVRATGFASGEAL